MSAMTVHRNGGASHAQAPRSIRVPRAAAVYTPRFDICETENEYILVGDLPGVEPDDLDIRYEKQELTIHGKVAPRVAEARYFAAEYGVGDFYRSFAIHEWVDAEQIAAELKEGVLCVRLPKRAEARPKRSPCRPAEREPRPTPVRRKG
jgi:HSP20 family protein